MTDVRYPPPAYQFEASGKRRDAAAQLYRFAERIAVLPERERIVFTLYYALGLTLKEIGELFGTTESTVSQIQTRALLTLRSSMLAIAS